MTFSPDGQNPYAPPAVSMDTRPIEVPLPDGVRRYRLNPDRYDRFQWTVQLRLYLVATPVFVGLCAILAAIGIPLQSVVAIFCVAMLWMIVARLVRIRMARGSALQTYELLVSHRVARRNLAGFVSAEILRPEVTRILEVPTGLWLTCDSPPRSLFVANAIDDFDDARSFFSRWAPIEKLGGFSLLSVARREGKKQGPRDMMFALALDASLQGELGVLRSVSQTAGLTQPPSRLALYARLMVIWFALLFMFLALWQFLAPNTPR